MNMEQKVLLIAVILIGLKFGLQFFLVRTQDKLAVQKFAIELLDWVQTALSALWIAFLIMYFVIQAFKIPSGSMKNTLLIKDHLFVNKFVYGARLPVPFIDEKEGFKIGEKKYLNIKMERFFVAKEPKRGDVVVFAFPQDTSKDFVKRCIGVPGDKIEIKDKILYVNDVKQNEPYVIHLDDLNYPADMPFLPDGLKNRDNFGPVVVPKDHFFVMGDNRDQSYDSRFWGFLQRDYLKGKAIYKFWPLKRIGAIR